MKHHLEERYRHTLKRVIGTGTTRKDRTGVGCTSDFGAQFMWHMEAGFPILTGRRMYPKIFKTEFDWFINGETNIARFKENQVSIWDAWADENGELGPVYGYQMRNFNGEGIDQLEAVLISLQENPDSRRHIISLWNPAQLDEMRLPPCYHSFQFFVEDKHLHMHILQRSGDMFLGVPYDICLFSLLLLYVADATGFAPGIIQLHIVDAHIYHNHYGPIGEYLNTEIFDAPKYKYEGGSNLELIDYRWDKEITAPVAV